ASYWLARFLIRRGPKEPTPIPEIVGFLFLASTLLVWGEVLWYLHGGWQWVMRFTVPEGPISWLLALVSMFAGLLILAGLLFVLTLGWTKVLRAGKSWSEIAIGLGFLLLLPVANLHLLTYDHWYLQRGALPYGEKERGPR